jgi:hypothetical protein
MLCKLGWHSWEKWTAPVNGIYCKSPDAIGYFQVCQRRVCEKCGIAEFRAVPQLRSVDDLKKER